MTNLLIQSGAKFNTSNKPDARYIISNDQFNWVTPFFNSLILTQNEGILLAQMFDYIIYTLMKGEAIIKGRILPNLPHNFIIIKKQE